MRRILQAVFSGYDLSRKPGDTRGAYRLAGLCGLLLAAALSTSACSVTTALAEPSVQAVPGDVLFMDDFSNPPSGWGISARDGASVEYKYDGLRIRVNEAQYDFWSVIGKNYSDIRIEADATKLGGPDDNDFGLVCRYRNKDNFYMLVISSDGYYGIAKLKNGLYSMIGKEQLQYSGLIRQGQATNRLSAECVGSKLSLFANGEKLMEAEDTDFQSGDVGLLAGAYEVQGVDILFDNFVAKIPGE